MGNEAKGRYEVRGEVKEQRSGCWDKRWQRSVMFEDREERKEGRKER